jgi:hypothetical protein
MKKRMRIDTLIDAHVALRQKEKAAIKELECRMATKRTTAKAAFIESMECLPVTKLPEGPEWSYEIKLYRLATGAWTWNFAGKTCDAKRAQRVHR